MDNRDDTHCFGSNFQPISFTSKNFTMFSFLPQYTEEVDIPICTGVTALKIDSGEVIILEFGEFLWFGNRMEKSQINPNQCRKFGIKICNDPTDPHIKMGIEVSEYLFIPMAMEVSTCAITTHPHNKNYLHDCQRILVLDAFY